MLPLAPPYPNRERRCAKYDYPHRVYLHTHQIKQFWVVQYLEADLKTPLGRMFHYTDLNRMRELLARGNATADERESFETGVRRWGIGSCFLTLTPEQYEKLKESQVALVVKLRGLHKVDWLFVFSCAAHNLCRLTRLIAHRQTATPGESCA
jgi:hypothetical protein